MISALALGYGVGMATPDSTISSMRAAVDAYHGEESSPNGISDTTARSHQWAGQGPTAMTPGAGAPVYYLVPGNAVAEAGMSSNRSSVGGMESPRLARIRTIASREGASCKLNRRNYSEASKYDADAEGAFDDLDELDAAGKEALTRLQLPDFKVAVTRSALKYVRFLTRSDRGRDLFESWLKRSGRYQDMIQQELREWGLPEDLIWVAMIESGFDPRVKSPAGAVGLWQFMRGTGDVYSLRVNRFVDERKNPVKATKAAAHHLRDLYQRFGSWDLAMAAYNMGYEQLLDAIDSHGTTDFAELARRRAIPSETSSYVPKIVAAALVANNLERYGFEEVKLYKPIQIAEMSVPAGTKLSTIAKAAGITRGTLRRYNPHLLTSNVPPGYDDFVVMIPSDTLSRARAALPAMVDRRVALNDGEVLDPMGVIGRLKGNDSSRYQRWNEGENLLRLLPKPGRRSLRSMLHRRPKSPGKDDGVAALAEEFGPRRNGRETVMYRVGAGDSLIKIARQFAVDVDDIARDNGLDVEDTLRQGALLRLLVKPNVLERWKSKSKRGSTAKGNSPSELKPKPSKRSKAKKKAKDRAKS